MKALTPTMIETLMDCHEREIQDLEPAWGINLTKNFKGLIIRQFLDARSYTCKLTGKITLAFFITEAGKVYLDKYLKNQNKLAF